MCKNKCAKCLCFAKADFMKPNLTFEMIQEIVQKYVKNVVSAKNFGFSPSLPQSGSRKINRARNCI